jgi:adenylate cyclase
LFVLAASLSLGEAYTWFTAAMAIVLQTALMLGAGRDPTFVVIVALATVLGTWLSLYARRRNQALVHAAVVEQTRRQKLGRYFSPQVAEAVLRGEREIGGGEVREVTVLFADLRDFTATAERLGGREAVALLNQFHGRMVGCIFGRGGTLDKYIGDGLMAYFGAPVAQADHAEQAVRCALDMHRQLAEMNRARAAAGLEPLRLGVGVHSGPVILGDIGAEQRREFTAIGDTVNVAARLEQLTKDTGAPTLVSEATRSRVSADLGFTPLEPVAVRGKSEPLRIYRLDGVA